MIKIYSIHFNKPEYIELQKQTIDKYFQIENEFIILNNSIDPSIHSEIENKCLDLNIKHIDCQNRIQSMDSKSHQNALSKFLECINDGEDIILLDHDTFFISNYDLDRYKEYDIVFLQQTKGHVIYPWTGFIVFNKIRNKDQMSFESGEVEGQNCDTGGMFYFYLKNSNLKVKSLSQEYIFDAMC